MDKTPARKEGESTRRARVVHLPLSQIRVLFMLLLPLKVALACCTCVVVAVLRCVVLVVVCCVASVLCCCGLCGSSSSHCCASCCNAAVRLRQQMLPHRSAGGRGECPLSQIRVAHVAVAFDIALACFVLCCCRVMLCCVSCGVLCCHCVVLLRPV
jgi:hypothetical protein